VQPRPRPSSKEEDSKRHTREPKRLVTARTTHIKRITRPAVMLLLQGVRDIPDAPRLLRTGGSRSAPAYRRAPARERLRNVMSMA
jgi:hypothetical protein